MTPTARYADIILPVNTFMERNEITVGHGTAFVGSQNQVIEPLGETKSILQIAIDLAEKMGVEGFVAKTEDEILEEKAAKFGITDYAKFKEEGIYRYPLPEPYVAFQQQINDPDNNPFYTASGKIEIDAGEIKTVRVRRTSTDTAGFPGEEILGEAEVRADGSFFLQVPARTALRLETLDAGGELILEDSLAALEAEFGERFLRVHRNALVAPAQSLSGLDDRDERYTVSVSLPSSFDNFDACDTE